MTDFVPKTFEEIPFFKDEEVKLPVKTIPDDDLKDFCFGWVYVRELGFFEVTAIGLHEWILATLEAWLQGTDEAWMEYACDAAGYAEKLLARTGVAYMSSSSAAIWVGDMKNLTNVEKVRFLRDTDIREL